MNKKMKNIKHNLIVLPGDIVSLDLYHLSDPKEKLLGTIVDIEERLECCNSGQTRVNDLITLLVKDEKSGEYKVMYYDRSYITKVLYRPEKQNHVPLRTIKNPDFSSMISSKGKFSMKKISLVAEQILKFYVSKEIIVDRVKILKVYLKDKYPGYSDKDNKIKFKIFKKWVLHNTNRIKRTRFEILKYQTDMNTLYEEDYCKLMRGEQYV